MGEDRGRLEGVPWDVRQYVNPVEEEDEQKQQQAVAAAGGATPP